MATLQQKFDITQDPKLRSRVSAAIVDHASVVSQEDTTNMEARLAKRRLALALMGLTQTEALVSPFARKCSTYAPIANAATHETDEGINTKNVLDADIETVVRNSWSEVATALATQ